MNIVHRDQLVKQLNWRYATKQFDPQRRITAEDWSALEDALVLTPSSFGLQPWRFIVVNDTATREKLLPASWNQRQVVDASHLVVFAVKNDLGERDIEEYIDRISEVRGVPPKSLEGFRGMMVGAIVNGMDASQRQSWAARQAYIALGNFLNGAALLGIDACPMEGIEPARYDEILGLNRLGLTTIVVAAAGYRHQSDSYALLKKVRFPREKVLLEV